MLFECSVVIHLRNQIILLDRKKLRSSTSWMLELFPEIPSGSVICDTCRKNLTKLKKAEKEEEDSSGPEVNITNNDPNFSATSTVVQTLNASLHELGESSIDKKKISSKNYAKSKVQKISSSMKRKLFVAAETSSDSDSDVNELILQNLKINFLNCNSRAKKLLILTSLPETWSIRKIMKEFNAPNYIVRQSKKLLKEKGFMEGPNPKPGKSLPIYTVTAVH